MQHVLAPLAIAAAPPFFAELAALILAASVIAYLAARRGMVPIVGFLIAGVVIGPNALGLIRDRALVESAAEIGVILLLFTIGIEFSLEKLNRIRRTIFAGGGLQVALATALTTVVLVLLGVELAVAVFTGFLVALSSTAIVLKLIADRGETSTVVGQTSVGVLIFQDLAIIVIALLVPVLGGDAGSTSEIAIRLGGALLLIGLVLLVARKLMPAVLEVVARTCSPELFLLTVIAICFGTAWVTSLAGVSLSLGAFLAGLVVSESRFSEHALGEVLPLQILFSATFFVSVGMLLDLRFLISNLPLIVAAVALVLIVKLVTTWIAARVLGLTATVSAAVALMLAQIGEFSFVLERLGASAGLTPAGLGEAGSQTFIAATVVLMIATPALANVSRRVRSRDDVAVIDATVDEGPHEASHLQNHVIVSGYGRAARGLVRVLQGAGVPYVIVTLSPAGASEAEEEGFPVLLGDSARQRTLEHVGAGRAKLLVIPDDDPAMVHRIVSVARAINPTMRIVARTRAATDAHDLAAAGVDLVVADEMESVVGLFADILGNYQVDPADIERYESALRAGGYAAVRELSEAISRVLPCSLDPDCFATRQITVRNGSPAAGMTREALRNELEAHDVELLQRRADDPASDMTDSLVPGSSVTLRGSSDAYQRAAHLFQTGKEAQEAPVVPERTVVDTDTRVRFDLNESPDECPHMADLSPVFPSARGCEECLATGGRWVHLRLCLTCGHVGCCDSSPNRHATKHFESHRHPVIASAEPSDRWSWCYIDERMSEGTLRPHRT